VAANVGVNSRPKVWIVAIMMGKSLNLTKSFCVVASDTLNTGAAYTVNGAVSGFRPLIVTTFGWTAYQSLLWQMPLGAVCFVTILLTGYLSFHVPNIRLLMLVVCCLPVIAGCAMIWRSTWTHHAGTPLVGYTLLGIFAPVTSLILSMGMANRAGASKNSFQIALIFIFYDIGNIVGPQLVKTPTIKRQYPKLWLGIIIAYCIVIVLAVVLYFMLMFENRPRDQMALDEKEAEKVAFEDLTDKENLHFRYVY
jgi:hypothetical protein